MDTETAPQEITEATMGTTGAFTASLKTTTDTRRTCMEGEALTKELDMAGFGASTSNQTFVVKQEVPLTFFFHFDFLFSFFLFAVLILLPI